MVKDVDVLRSSSSTILVVFPDQETLWSSHYIQSFVKIYTEVQERFEGKPKGKFASHPSREICHFFFLF
jgi:hypothetical protein